MDTVIVVTSSALASFRATPTIIEPPAIILILPFVVNLAASDLPSVSSVPSTNYAIPTIASSPVSSSASASATYHCFRFRFSYSSFFRPRLISATPLASVFASVPLPLSHPLQFRDFLIINGLILG